MNHPRRRSSGFVLLTAVLMLAIVAVAALAMTNAAASRSRHQANSQLQAQLEQLLLAGAKDAAARFSSDSRPKAGDAIAIDLPNTLKEIGAQLDLQVDPSTTDALAVANIRASINGHVVCQTIRLAKASPEWRVQSASLN